MSPSNFFTSDGPVKHKRIVPQAPPMDLFRNEMLASFQAQGGAETLVKSAEAALDADSEAASIQQPGKKSSMSPF